MPELPEVETVRQTLIKAGIIDSIIQKVEVYNNKLFKDISEKEFIEKLEGKRIQKIERKGKWLLFFLEELVLFSHLRMTGKYFFDEGVMNPAQKKSIYLTFFLNDGKKVIYSDARGFGIFYLQSSSEYKELKPYKNIGQDLLNEEINLEELFTHFQKIKNPIKMTLLEQDIVSGIGNIYASEILFITKIYPLKITKELAFQQVKEIINQTQSIFKEAVRLGGTSIVDFVNPLNQKGSYQKMLKVYGREKEPCDNCGNLIKQLRINNRSAFFCDGCQKE